MNQILNTRFVCFVLLFLFLVTNTMAVSFTFKKNYYQNNSTGINIGFWANYTNQGLVYSNYGIRGVERVGFYSWKNYETSPGVYTWGNQFNLYKRAHLFGNDAIGCANISFTPELNGGKKNTIPEFYGTRITDSLTRIAAKKYVYAMVQEMLRECGSMMLAIDYETSYNYQFGTGATDTASLNSAIRNAQEWSNWYVEAAHVARQAASDIGMSDKLKLIPIMNGDPRKQAITRDRTIEQNSWLKNVVDASDILGFDTYQKDVDIVNTNSQSIIDVCKYWINNYSFDKPVFMCETGFSSYLSFNPTGVVDNLKYYGTEAEQSIFLSDLLEKIYNETLNSGSFQNKFKGFCIWSIMDNGVDAKVGDFNYSFGLFHVDKTPKPAVQVVKQKFDQIENNEYTAAKTLYTSETVSPDWNKGISLLYTSGNEHNSLVISVADYNMDSALILKVGVLNKGGVLIKVNDEKWLYDISLSNSIEFDISSLLHQGDNRLELFFTGEIFPFQQVVESIEFLEKNSTGLHSLNDQMGFSYNVVNGSLIIRQNNHENLKVKLYDVTGNLIDKFSFSDLSTSIDLCGKGVFICLIEDSFGRNCSFKVFNR